MIAKQIAYNAVSSVGWLTNTALAKTMLEVVRRANNCWEMELEKPKVEIAKILRSDISLPEGTLEQALEKRRT